MKKRRWRRHRQQPVDLDITAFLNLMVILVPFLLVTAVFSRIAIIELGLPSRGEGGAADEVPLRLEITVREDRLEVANRGGKPLLLPRRGDDHDYDGLADVLKAIKAEYPAQTDATILLEPEIPYEVLVRVMDTTRVGTVVQPGTVTRVDLFPGISIGDAAPRHGDA
jgi:biopolymer transport protein ExbD